MSEGSCLIRYLFAVLDTKMRKIPGVRQDFGKRPIYKMSEGVEIIKVFKYLNTEIPKYPSTGYTNHVMTGGSARFWEPRFLVFDLPGIFGPEVRISL